MAERKDVSGTAGGVLNGIDIDECFRRTHTIRVLVCGKTGLGKSSLVNSLVGFKVCKVGHPAYNLSGVTKEVNSAEANADGVIVTIYDSPGLQDGTADEEAYLEDMYKKCKDVDLVIYCVDMTIARYSVAEIRATELLTKKFGEEFWNHCVLVMTKANLVSVPREERGDKRGYHQRLYRNLLQTFRRQLISQGIRTATANAIPAVAAGLYDPEVKNDDPDNERYVWYVSDKSVGKDEDRPVDFLAELWVTCFEVIRGSAQTNFLRTTTRTRDKPPFELETGNQQELQRLLEEREKIEREMREKVEQKLQEQGTTTETELTSKCEEKLATLREEIENVHVAPPPFHDASNRLKLTPEQQKRVIDAMRAENEFRMKAVGAAFGTIGGATAGAIGGGIVGAFGGPVGIVFGTAIGAVIGGIICGAYGYLKGKVRASETPYY